MLLLVCNQQFCAWFLNLHFYRQNFAPARNYRKKKWINESSQKGYTEIQNILFAYQVSTAQ